MQVGASDLAKVNPPITPTDADADLNWMTAVIGKSIPYIITVSIEMKCLVGKGGNGSFASRIGSSLGLPERPPACAGNDLFQVHL